MESITPKGGVASPIHSYFVFRDGSLSPSVNLETESLELAETMVDTSLAYVETTAPDVFNTIMTAQLFHIHSDGTHHMLRYRWVEPSGVNN